jgi:AI-2 transport system permease protein
MIGLKWLKSWEFALVIVLVVEILILGAINPNFLSLQNLLFSTSDFTHVIFAALGLTLVIITAGIDISGVSIMGLSSIVLGLTWVATKDINLAVAAALVVGCLAGAFNGAFVAFTDINPLVITLGSMFMFAGVATGLPGVLSYLGFKAYGAGGFAAYQYEGITGLPPEFGNLALGGIGWVPNPLIAVLVLAVTLSLVLHRTAFGRYLFLIGVNPGAARYSGVPVKRVLITVYLINGFCAAIAGVMLTSYFTSARSDLGSEALLPIITAVVLGGASILGGSGTVVGTLLAGLVLGFLRQGLLALGVTNNIVPVVVGGLLISIVAVKLLTADLNLKRRNRRAYRILKAVEGMPPKEGA